MPRFAKEKNCTGCTACMSVCPKQCIIMKADKEGFFYPEVMDKNFCIDCRLCEKICPVTKKKTKKKEIAMAYAAYSKNEPLRMESSSGGIFSEIASVILEDGGIVYGAAYSEVFCVEHKGIQEKKELYKLRGAKYAQSDLKNTFCEILKYLKSDKKVLFSGTPCQVAGLKAFLQKEYDNLVCIDFVCHGVPSPRVWEQYVKYRAKSDNNEKFPQKINMRSKHTGWSRYRYSNLYEYDNGKTYSAFSGEDLFMRLFIGNYINRKSCSNCKFKGYERQSDLTLADFWGVWNRLPEMDDNKGTSGILINSEQGERLFEAISKNIKTEKIELREIGKGNPSMLYSSMADLQRKKVLKSISEDGFDNINFIIRQNKKFSKTRKIVWGVYQRVKYDICNRIYNNCICRNVDG